MFRKLLVRLSFLVWVCALSFAREVRADDVADEADVQFNLGAELYQGGEYSRALAHFLASNRLARNRNVLFNIARCYEQLRQFPEAHRYYTRAIEGETNTAALARAQEALERIEPLVGILEIVTEPPGARLFLDRKDLGERGTAPQRMALPPASYRVIAELPGFRDETSAPITVKRGSEQRLVLQLKQIVGTIRVPGERGATVRLDADNAPEACRVPCSVRARPGQHTVIVSRPGYRVARVPVSVEADRTTTIAPDLVPESGSLVVDADEDGAAIEIGGVTRGFTPAIVELPTGTHRVRVRLRGFRTAERTVVIVANRQTRFSVQLSAVESVEAASRITEYAEDAPASVSVIGGQELRAMRYPTLAEAMRGTRGTYVSDDRGYQALGFRGFGRPGAYGNRVLITLDGVPLNDDWIWSSYVGFDLRTDLDDIERIEIVRGPGSVLYGTSAFSGVVNLVSRQDEEPSTVEVGVSAAADGVARARARVARRFGADGRVWASLAAGKSQGRDFFFPEYVADGPPEVAGHARGVDGAEFGTFAGRATWKALGLSWSLHHHDKQLPTGQFDTLLGDERTRQADTRGFVEARLEPTFGAVRSLTRVHVNRYTYRGYFARPSTDGGLETNRYDSTWFGAEQRVVFVPSPLLTLSLGGEAQAHPEARQRGATELDGEYFDDTRDFTLAAAYGSLDVRPIPELKLSAGGRLDYYSTFGSSFNPRVALVARPYPRGNLKLIAAKAFKAPSVYELYYSAVGQQSSPGLQPENIYSIELELGHRIDANLLATVAGYVNYITDLISLVELPPAPDGTENIQFQNTTTPVGTMGVELEVRRDWKDGVMFAATYSLQRSRYLASESLGALIALDESPDYRHVPNAPTHLASVRGAVPILGRALTAATRLSFEGRRLDVYDSAGEDAPQLSTDHALYWDFVFSGTEARWKLDYAVGVYNAFDSRAEHPVSTEFRQRSIPVTGRSLLASATLHF